MDFDNKEDKGSCVKVEDSKYEDAPSLDIAADDAGIPDEIPLDTLPEYFVIEADDVSNSTDTTTEVDVEAAKILLNDTASIFLQTDA